MPHFSGQCQKCEKPVNEYWSKGKMPKKFLCNKCKKEKRER